MQEVTDNLYVLVFYSVGGIFLLVVGFLYLTVHSQNRLLKQKRQLQEAELSHQKNLLHAVIRSQEEERQRIGRDLHDEIGGGLAALRLNIGSMLAAPAANRPPSQKEPYKEIIDNLISAVRHISHNLSPPGLTIFGLQNALEQLCATINFGSLQVQFSAHESEPGKALTEQEALALYRVVQELFSNTMKHARASQVNLHLQQEPAQTTLTYSDNGVGFQTGNTAASPGMGMQNIESRLEMIGANYRLTTAPNQGFRIRITLPRAKS